MNGIVLLGRSYVHTNNKYLGITIKIIHADVLASFIPMTKLISCKFSHRKPDIACNTKSITTAYNSDHCLLQVLFLHQCHFWYRDYLHHIPVKMNQMYGGCSRLWNMSVSRFLFYFDYILSQRKMCQMIPYVPILTLLWYSTFIQDYHWWNFTF